MKPLGKILLLLLLCSISFGTYGQKDSSRIKDSLDIYDLSLEELLQLKAHGVPTELEELINTLITVSSKKSLNTRESPGIVSVITAEDIQRSGARDMIDVLRMVPGIDFGTDVENVIGLGVRGNWANEGKILLLVDGQEMNEIIWTSITLGNHYPIEQIKRIEIIRGPGSAIYGGYAEYGVINIITFQGEDLKGIRVSGTYGLMEKGLGRRNLNLSIGQKNKNFSYSISGLFGEGQRSDQTYTDFSGSSYSMNGNSAANPRYLNIGLQYKGWSFRGIADYFFSTQGAGYGNVVKQGSVSSEFNSLFAELKYNRKLRKNLTVTPRINFKTQDPWKSPGFDDEPPYHIHGTRLTENVTFSYDPNRSINVIFGGESYQDKAKYLTDSTYFSNNSSEVNYLTVAGFVQGLIKTNFSNFIIGARFDKNTAFGQAFVPRFGMTKIFNNFHYKFLFGRSFRAPSIANFNSADVNGIKPEFSDVIELEAGYKISKNSIFTLNIFDISTSKPIVYYNAFDTTNNIYNEFYTNFGFSGTQGIEAEYRVKTKKGDMMVNYSYYTAAKKPRISSYQTGNSSALLGFANHRINLSATYLVLPELSFNTTISFYGKRWAVVGVDSLDNSILEETDEKTLINLFVNYETKLKGLRIGAGVYDALNQKFTFIQPYNGGHAALPGPSREFLIRVQYRLQK
jgi:outer membrane receptor for ferrienterochelin and colicin